jgi:GTP cyclohydrolase II
MPLRPAWAQGGPTREGARRIPTEHGKLPNLLAGEDVASISGVTCLADAALPTRFGAFRLAVFRVVGTSAEAPALIYGDLSDPIPPLVRLHSECLTGDVLGSLRCDCGEQLDASLARIAESHSGILLYLRQEGRGIGLVDKVRAYALQDTGLDTVDANVALGLPVDRREYASAAAILSHLGAKEVRLLTNNPAKLRALERHGVSVVERVPLEVPPNASNVDYLRTKAARMGHLLAIDDRNGRAEGGREATAPDLPAQDEQDTP